MMRHTVKTKVISLFVLAFVCLNAVGAACVAYCRVAEWPDATATVPVSSHHCQKATGTQEDPRRPTFGPARAVKPCPMTVSFFGAPLEKHQSAPANLTLPETGRVYEIQSRLVVFRSVATAFGYRGPPLLDHRIDRIKHRVLLI